MRDVRALDKRLIHRLVQEPRRQPGLHRQDVVRDCQPLIWPWLSWCTSLGSNISGTSLRSCRVSGMG